MNDINETYLAGRAVDDIKVFKYDDRIKYSFIVAINYYSSKKKQEYSEFIPVSFWKSHPNKDLDGLKKGDSVIVNGRLSINPYEKDGIKRVSVEVVANYVKIFKLIKEAKDMDGLLTMITSNQHLLDAVMNSTDIQLSDSLKKELKTVKSEA